MELVRKPSASLETAHTVLWWIVSTRWQWRSPCLSNLTTGTRYLVAVLGPVVPWLNYKGTMCRAQLIFTETLRGAGRCISKLRTCEHIELFDEAFGKIQFFLTISSSNYGWFKMSLVLVLMLIRMLVKRTWHHCYQAGFCQVLRNTQPAWWDGLAICWVIWSWTPGNGF